MRIQPKWTALFVITGLAIASSCTRNQRVDERKMVEDRNGAVVNPDSPTTAGDDKIAKKANPSSVSDQLFLFDTGIRCVIFNQAGLTLECNGWNPSGRYLTKALAFSSGVTVSWERAIWLDAAEKSIGEFKCFERGTEWLSITCSLSGMPANAKSVKIYAKVLSNSTTDQAQKSRDEEVTVSLDRSLPRPARP